MDELITELANATDPYRYFPTNFKTKYAINEWGHALAILNSEFCEQFYDICEVLDDFELRKSSIVTGGGGKSQVSGFLDSALYERHWVEKSFDTTIMVDGVTRSTPTHKIDCVKGRIALDIEWNNKTEFYDRDLSNFRLLHNLDAISVGIIITRATELQDEVFKPLGIGAKYGASTTHSNKLIPKIVGGAAGGCPILVIAVQPGAYVADI